MAPDEAARGGPFLLVTHRWEIVALSVEQFHWLLEGIDLAAMRKHPERHYARLGTVALPRRAIAIVTK